MNSNPKDFLLEVIADEGPPLKARITEKMANRVRLIRDENGNIIGRGAMTLQEKKEFSNVKVSVGGFNVSSGIGLKIDDVSIRHFLGILSGSTSDVSRKTAYPIARIEEFSNFVSDQVKLMEIGDLRFDDQMRISQAVLGMKADPGDLGFCFLAGRIENYKSTCSFIDTVKEFIVPLNVPFSSRIDVTSLKTIPSELFLLGCREDLIVTNVSEEYKSLVDDDEGRRYLKLRESEVPDQFINSYLKTACGVWLSNYILRTWEKVSLRIERDVICEDRSTGNDYWILKVIKNSDS